MNKLSSLLVVVLPGLVYPAVGETQEPLWILGEDTAVTLEIYSELSPLELNRIHSWNLVLKQADGAPISDAEIDVSGGMPLHDHGLPTQPLVNGELTPGRYLLEGIRFHMPGQWQLFFSISYADNTETLQLDFEL